jgi:hypothetical protein
MMAREDKINYLYPSSWEKDSRDNSPEERGARRKSPQLTFQNKKQPYNIEFHEGTDDDNSNSSAKNFNTNGDGSSSSSAYSSNTTVSVKNNMGVNSAYMSSPGTPRTVKGSKSPLSNIKDKDTAQPAISDYSRPLVQISEVDDSTALAELIEQSLHATLSGCRRTPNDSVGKHRASSNVSEGGATTATTASLTNHHHSNSSTNFTAVSHQSGLSSVGRNSDVLNGEYYPPTPPSNPTSPLYSSSPSQQGRKRINSRANPLASPVMRRTKEHPRQQQPLQQQQQQQEI